MWSDADDRWPARNAEIARHIPPGSKVIDLGAGAQGLRDMLVDCEYTPADIVQRTPDTVAFDMNGDVWPKGRWDVAVMSGVLEYADNPRDVLAHVRFMARTVLFTYRHRRTGGDLEAGLFANHLSRGVLALHAHRAGWRKMLVVSWWNDRGARGSGKATIYRLE